MHKAMKTIPRERPIIFSAPMVRAILDGRKAMTRRVVKGTTEHKGRPNPAYLERWKDNPGWASICPHGQPGDRLWVRETWVPRLAPQGVYYRADGVEDDSGERDGWWFDIPEKPGEEEFVSGILKWKPSIFMPRWASRLTLEITAVRVERVQDITQDDARAEGFDVDPLIFHEGDESHNKRRMEIYRQYGTAIGDDNWMAGERDVFAAYWDSLNAKRGYGWAANPFVWAISFRRLP